MLSTLMFVGFKHENSARQITNRRDCAASGSIDAVTRSSKRAATADDAGSNSISGTWTIPLNVSMKDSVGSMSIYGSRIVV